MRAYEALNMAETCGLKTISEAFSNVNMHAMNFFVYDKIEWEIMQLVRDLEILRDKFGINKDTTITPRIIKLAKELI
jgi:uncharacterized protein with HEPN domain